MGQKQFAYIQQSLGTLPQQVRNKYQIKYSSDGYPYYISQIETNQKYSLRCLSFKTEKQYLKVNAELQKRKGQIYDKNPHIIGFQGNHQDYVESFLYQETKIIDENLYRIFLLVLKPEPHLEQYFCQYLQEASKSKQAKQKPLRIPQTQIWNILFGFIKALSCLQKHRISFGAVRPPNIIYDYAHLHKYENINKIIQIHDPITNQPHQQIYTNFSLAKERKQIYNQSTCNICSNSQNKQLQISSGILYEKMMSNYLSPQQLEILDKNLSQDSYDKYKSDVYVFGYMIIQFLWNYYVSETKKQQKWEFEQSNQQRISIQKIKFKTGISRYTNNKSKKIKQDLVLKKLWIVRKKIKQQYQYYYSQQLYSLLQKMLRQDPKQRYNWMQLQRIIQCSEPIQQLMTGKITDELRSLKHSSSCQPFRNHRVYSNNMQQSMKQIKIDRKYIYENNQNCMQSKQHQPQNQHAFSNSIYKVKQKEIISIMKQSGKHIQQKSNQLNSGIQYRSYNQLPNKQKAQNNQQIYQFKKGNINTSGRTTNDAFSMKQKSLLSLGSKMKSKSTKNLNQKYYPLIQSIEQPYTQKKMMKSYSQHQNVAIPISNIYTSHQIKTDRRITTIPYSNKIYTESATNFKYKQHQFAKQNIIKQPQDLNFRKNGNMLDNKNEKSSYPNKSPIFFSKQTNQNEATIDEIIEKIQKIKKEIELQNLFYTKNKEKHQLFPLSLTTVSKQQNLKLNQIANSSSSHSNKQFLISGSDDKERILWHDQKSKTSRKVSIIDTQQQKSGQQMPFINKNSVRYQISFVEKGQKQDIINVQINEIDEFTRQSQRIKYKPYPDYSKMRCKSDKIQNKQKTHHLRSHSNYVSSCRQQYKSQLLKISKKKKNSIKNVQQSKFFDPLKGKLQTVQQSLKTTKMPPISQLIQICFPNGSYYYGQIDAETKKKQGYGELVYPLQLSIGKHQQDCKSQFKNVKFVTQNDNICHCYIRKCAYIGQWQQDAFHGYGHLFNDVFNVNKLQVINYKVINLTQQNWQKYFGEFKMDVRQGYGQLYFGQNCYYIGQFKDNLIDGQGIFYLKQNNFIKIIKGFWRQNQLVEIYQQQINQNL